MLRQCVACKGLALRGGANPLRIGFGGIQPGKGKEMEYGYVHLGHYVHRSHWFCSGNLPSLAYMLAQGRLGVHIASYHRTDAEDETTVAVE
jgi:hypothetical protein